jgi:transposase
MRCERGSVVAVLPAGSRGLHTRKKEADMRVVGLDIHRVFAEAVMLEGGKTRRLARVGMTRDHLAAFARTLTHDDHVVVEATGNAIAVVEVLRAYVGRVVIANPRQVRLISEARIKTDVIDATVLARLYASGFLPEVWMPDEATLGLRRQVTRRTQIVRQRSRLKTIVQSILHAHLVPQCPHADLFGPRGRSWLMDQPLPADEGDAVARHLRGAVRLTAADHGNPYPTRSVTRPLSQSTTSDVPRPGTGEGADGGSDGIEY